MIVVGLVGLVGRRASQQSARPTKDETDTDPDSRIAERYTYADADGKACSEATPDIKRLLVIITGRHTHTVQPSLATPRSRRVRPAFYGRAMSDVIGGVRDRRRPRAAAAVVSVALLVLAGCSGASQETAAVSGAGRSDAADGVGPWETFHEFGRWALAADRETIQIERSNIRGSCADHRVVVDDDSAGHTPPAAGRCRARCLLIGA